MNKPHPHQLGSIPELRTPSSHSGLARVAKRSDDAATSLPTSSADDSISQVNARTKAVTLGALGEYKLGLLCEGLGISGESEPTLNLFRTMSESWANLPYEQNPWWRNDITDDHSPFEFSLAFEGGKTKVRILVESQALPIEVHSSWAAGLQLHARVSDGPGVSLARFETIRSLFVPDPRIAVRFSMWHGAWLAEGDREAYKVYLNPNVRGPAFAEEIVHEAMRRLGLAGAWEFLASRLRARGKRDKIVYFSLDLSADREARVKVYIAHEGTTADEVDHVVQGCRDGIPRDASEWIRGLLGHNGPFNERPVLSCFAFSSENDVPRMTVHVPIRCYVRNDAEAVDRLSQFLPPEQTDALRSGMRNMLRRPLEAGCGALTYASFRRLPSGRCVTAYISPEIYPNRRPTWV